MKLTISREALLTPLQIIAGVVERKQTMPVLSNVLLEAEQGQLTITGTNMEVELVSRMAEVDIVSEGRITVPARKMVDICKALSDHATVQLEVKEERLHIESGQSQFTLSTLPAEHFPNVEADKNDVSMTLSQAGIKKMLDATAFAMAQQDVRYYLNGMLFELEPDHIRVVATDGHRLAMATDSVNTGLESTRQIIVPRKGVQELARLLSDGEETLELIVGDSHIRATVGSYTFTSKLIEGKFPDYNRVIPRGGDKVVIADRSELKSVLNRASILSHENIRGIRLQLESGTLHVYANNPEHEQAEDSLPVQYQGEPLQIGFNVSYLIDVLGVIGNDSVRITLANPNSSALITSAEEDNAVYVVMPMRL